jgi:lipopolysaccharide transport system ATP-binding protein
MHNSEMRELAMRVEGLGKRYYIKGKNSTPEPPSRLSRLLQRAPFLRRRPPGEPFWALRDATFELKRGEVLGVIGRNGSGKSTLLKILSGVTMPTEGRAEVYGRVGSLLEVGTGFHPDLTGRENIFMNGALLGIKQQEIRRRFDDIVEYSGIGAFIDVPVKRYSSGMYVRLAYSVTALLRSDILLLDEVLAVGDAEFQHKTKRSVESIAHDGRAVIFVSHSMSSVQKLCSSVIWLDQGRVVLSGPVEEVIHDYMEATTRKAEERGADIADLPPYVDLSRAQGFFDVRDPLVLTSVETLRDDGTPTRVFSTGEPMRIRIGYEVPASSNIHYFTIFFQTLEEERVMVLYSTHGDRAFHLRGTGSVECRIPELRLVSGDYSIMLDFGVIELDPKSVDCVPDATLIRVEMGEYLGPQGLVGNQGWIAQRSQWEDKGAL